jgi:integrase
VGGGVQAAKAAPGRRWHGQLLKDGPGLSTTAKCYRLVRAILNSAVEDHHLALNPCTIRGAGVEPAEERRIPTVAEVYGLADSVSPRFRAFVLLYAFVGLRRGELLGLTRRDLDLLHRTVTVRAQRQESKRGETLIGPPKSEAGRRTVALPAEIIDDLDHHLASWAAPGPDGLIFMGGKGGPVRPGVLQRDWDRARHSAVLSHLHIHGLRHVAGTRAAATGGGTKEIMPRLGQSTPQAALRYQHTTERARPTGCDENRPAGPGGPPVGRASGTGAGGRP